MHRVTSPSGNLPGTVSPTLSAADTQTLAELAQLSPDGLARLTLNGRFTDVNPAITDFLGWYPEVLRGRALTALAHPDDREGVDLRLARLLAASDDPLSGASEYLLMRARRVDARYGWLELRVHLERDADGVAIGLIAALRPVDERQLAHLSERRRTSEHAALMRIGQAIAEGVIDADLCHRSALELVEVLGAQAVLVYRADPGSEVASCVSSAWRDLFGDAHPEALDEPLSCDGPAAGAITTGEPLVIDLTTCSSDHAQGLSLMWRTAVAVPIDAMGDGARGALVSVHGYGEPTPDDATARVLGLAAELIGAVMARR